MIKPLKEYKKRQEEWRNISTTQFSTTNNVLTSLVAGLFVIILDKSKLRRLKIDFESTIEWPLTCYYFALSLALFSIIYGVLVMLSRLYDFRISRNIALTRLRIYKKYKRKLPSLDKELNSIKTTDIIKLFCRILFSKINYLSSPDINTFEGNQNEFKKNFNQLRRQSRVLGSASWRLTKIQIGLALLALVTYLFHLTFDTQY